MTVWFKNDDNKVERYRVTITPSMAQELMDNNVARLKELGLVPRAVSAARVRQYTEEILTGEWAALVDAIHIAPNGAVLNGQHRLQAIIAAGKAVVLDVVKNTPPSWYVKFDTGHRTTGDDLTIGQANYSKNKASLVPLVWAYFEGKVGTYLVEEVSGRKAVSIDRDYGVELDEAIEFSKDADYKANYVAFMYFILKRADHLDTCLSFLEQFKDGANMKKNSPAMKLRNKIVKYGRNIRNKELLAKMFYVANRIIEGDDVKQLKSDFSYRLSDGTGIKKRASRRKSVK